MAVMFWFALMIGFIILEAVTASLVSVWFAVGALGGCICALAHMGTTATVTVFAIVSLVTLILFRRFYKKGFEKKHVPTNADRIIGKTAVTKSAIVPDGEVGSVAIDGKIWSAVSDEYIGENEKVEVERITGVKLVVRKKEEKV